MPLAAQVTQRPLPLEKARLLPAAQAQGDLVITGVTVWDNQNGVPRTVATVRFKNAGSAPISVPSSSVLFRGDPVRSGGVTFPPVGGFGFTLAPGEEKSLPLDASVCAGAKAGAVTFRIDPENSVREANEGNNSFAVPSASSFGNADIQVAEAWMEAYPAAWVNSGPGSGPMNPKNVVPLNEWANLVVSFRNQGTAPLLLCPNAVILAETQSPVSSKHGLRTFTVPRPDPWNGAPWNTSAAVRVAPGQTFTFSLPQALLAAELPLGTYTWAIKLNPSGQINETSSANNTATTSVKVVLPTGAR